MINRKSVPLDPQTNMNAVEDFLLLVLHAHIVAAGETISSYVSVTSVSDLARRILNNYVYLPHPGAEEEESMETTHDGVHFYSMELLTLSLIWHSFHDAIKEGDGERIVRYWKLLLIIFKASNHRNYAKEAVLFLFQYFYQFSDRQKEQLLWGRFVNTQGRAGANIPSDLHMEHLNRRLKTVLRNMEANVNPNSVVKAGKCIAAIHRVCKGN